MCYKSCDLFGLNLASNCLRVTPAAQLLLLARSYEYVDLRSTICVQTVRRQIWLEPENDWRKIKRERERERETDRERERDRQTDKTDRQERERGRERQTESRERERESRERRE